MHAYRTWRENANTSCMSQGCFFKSLPTFEDFYRRNRAFWDLSRILKGIQFQHRYYWYAKPMFILSARSRTRALNYNSMACQMRIAMWAPKDENLHIDIDAGGKGRKCSRTFRAPGTVGPSERTFRHLSLGKAKLPTPTLPIPTLRPSYLNLPTPTLRSA